MDILQLDVPQEEIENLLGEEEGLLGDEWPITGMECPVTGCPSGSHHFKTIGSYWQHFQKFHQKLTPLYHCPGCRFKDTKMSDIRRHVRKFHPKLCFCILKQTVKNEKYVDPKGFKRPRPRIHHEEREKARLAREEERKKRRPLFSLPSNSNPRDLKCPPGGFRK